MRLTEVQTTPGQLFNVLFQVSYKTNYDTELYYRHITPAKSLGQKKNTPREGVEYSVRLRQIILVPSRTCIINIYKS